MPRKARSVSSTGFYHIIIRGNNKKYIFEEKLHKLDFIEALFQQEKLGFIELAAWCVMDNHVHIILKAELEDMSKAFKSINQRFANKYNTGTHSVGHVYDNRFMSKPIETDEYLTQSIRYVHNNPVKAKIVDGPEGYDWSSYRTFEKYAGHLNRPQMSFVMGFFDGDMEKFAKWHELDDAAEHFDIKEDLDQFYMDRAGQVIQDYSVRYGLQSRDEFMFSMDVMDSMIIELQESCHLPLRKIAGLLELPFSRVQGVWKSVNRLDM